MSAPGKHDDKGRHVHHVAPFVMAQAVQAVQRPGVSSGVRT